MVAEELVTAVQQKYEGQLAVKDTGGFDSANRCGC